MRTVAALAVGVLATLTALGQNDNASITGRVTDSAGAVVPAAQAELRSESKPEIFLRGTSDASGVYVFDRLMDGDYTLRLIKPGFASLVLKSIHIATGEHTSLPNVQLSVSYCGSGPAPEYLRILKSPREVGDVGGSVRLDPGPTTDESPPISKARVDLVCGRSPCRTTTTDSQGHFLFKNVPPGEYAIRVSHAGLYTGTRSGYEVQEARERIYYPVYLERCFRANCDPAKRPKKPLAICE
jgi:hypothetical protein